MADKSSASNARLVNARRRAHVVGKCIASLAAFAAMCCVPAFAVAAAPAVYPVVGQVVCLDDAASGLVGSTGMEKVADGLTWTEGPLWLQADESLLFEDMLNNRICRWKEGEGVSVFLDKSGDTKGTCKAYNPGSNGMVLGRDGFIYICQHGDRRIAKMNPATREFTTAADKFDGKRLNSPNDVAFDADGNLFFTDPPYGLVSETDSELGFSGVYRLTPDGKLTLLTKSLSRPNGIALSPDGKTLYVNDSDEKSFALHAFELKADGTLGKGRVLWDAMPFAKEGSGATDGMKVDEHGNIWTTGPGGLYVISPEGKLLLRLKVGEPCGNCTFGGPDGRTLFIMANHSVLRIQTKVRGAR